MRLISICRWRNIISFLRKNDTYAEINTELRSEMKEIREGIQMEMSEQLTDKWKQQYRRSHI